MILYLYDILYYYLRTFFLGSQKTEIKSKKENKKNKLIQKMFHPCIPIEVGS